MILNEIILSKPIIEETQKVKLPEGVLCRVSYSICNIGKRNANNRVYEDDVYDKVMAEKDLQEKLENRCLFGHAEHPEQTQSNLEKTSHVIIEMWKADGQVWQKFDVLDTPGGRIVDCLIRANCLVGCSTRAEGDLEEAEDDDGTYQNVIADSYNYVTTDFTADPSTFGVMPHDVKRSIVSEVKKLLENKEADVSEKEFGVCILEGMQCKDRSKCQNCGACKVLKENKIVEKKTMLDLINDKLIKVGQMVEYKDQKWKVSKIEEGVVSLLVGAGNPVAVNVDGDAAISISPEGLIAILPTEVLEPKEAAVEPEVTAPAVEPDVPVEEPLAVEEVPEGKINKQEIARFGTKKKKQPGKESIEVGASVKIEEKEKLLSGEEKVYYIEGKVTKIEETGITISLDDGTTVCIEDPTAVHITVTAPAPAEEIEPVGPPEDEIDRMEAAGPLPIRKESKTSEGELPTESGVSEEVAPGNLLRDKEGKDWSVREVEGNGLTVIQPGSPGTEKFIEWNDVGSYGFTKVSETKVKEAKLWGMIWLKDGTEVNLEGTDPSELNIDPNDIEYFGEHEIGDEAQILDSETKEVYDTLDKVKGLFAKYYKEKREDESKVEEATSVEKDGEWFVESPSGAILGGPYKSKVEADKRKKNVEFYAASKESKVDEGEEEHPSGFIFHGDKVKVLRGSRKGEVGEVVDITTPEEDPEELPEGQFDVKMPDGKMIYLGWDDVELVESKLSETAGTKAMYKAAKLPAPDGKDIHTKAFHELVVNVAKGYVKGGDTPKEALAKAYPTAMKQLGKEKAVKKPHQKESKVDEGFKTDLKNKDKAAVTKRIGAITDKLLAGETLSSSDNLYWKDYGTAVKANGANESKVDEHLEDRDVKELERIIDAYLLHDEYGLSKIVLRRNVDGARSSIQDFIRTRKSSESKVAESISTTAKEITNLRVQEASTRAERDKAIELLEEITDEKTQLVEKVRKEKAFEVKILVNKIGKTLEAKEQEVDALRAKLEEKAKLVADLTGQITEQKESATKIKGQMNETAIRTSKYSNSLKEDVKAAEDKHQKDLTETKERYRRRLANVTKSLKEKIERAKKETEERVAEEITSKVTGEFVKSFVEFKLSETDLKVDENSRALLENCKSLEEVDDLLDEIVDVSRRSALHSDTITGIHVIKHEKSDLEQEEAERNMDNCFEGMGYVKK